MILHHFTAERLLPSVLRDGLTLGAIPVTATKILRGYIWLTTNDSFTQSWNVRRLISYTRTHARITVDLSELDVRLMRWLDAQHLTRIPAMLNNGHDAENWYVYKGIILPSQFRSITINPAVPA